MSDNKMVTEREAVMSNVPHDAPNYSPRTTASKRTKGHMTNPTEEVTE